MPIKLLLLLLLSSQAVSTCFSDSTLPGGRILKGDIHSVNLDSFTTGNQAEFSLSWNASNSDLTNNKVTVTPRYPITGVRTPFEQPFAEGCSDAIKGLTDNVFVMICDKTKVIIVTVKETTMAILEVKTIELPTDVQVCHKLARDPKSSMILAACISSQNSLMLFTIDIKGKTASPVINSGLKEVSTGAKGLQLLVNEHKDQSTSKSSANIFVWEVLDAGETNQTPQPSFFSFKSVEGVYEFTGYFSKATGNVEGTGDGVLVELVSDTDGTLMITKNANKFLIQKCDKEPKDKKFSCQGQPKEIIDAAKDFKILMSRVDSTLVLSKLFKIFIVQKDKYVAGTLDPESLDYSEDRTINLEGSKLTKLQNAFNYKESLYLVGPVVQENSKSSGIVKVDLRKNTFSQKLYDLPSSISEGKVINVVLRDPLDARNVYLLTITSDALTSYLIRPVRLLAHTANFPEDEYLKVTVKCDTGKETSEASLLLNIQQKLEDAMDINLPDTIEAYSGSKKIFIPLNNDEISGNGLSIQSIELNPSEIKYAVEFAKNEQNFEKNSEDTINDLTDIEHVGEDYFITKTKESSDLFYCRRDDNQKFTWIKKKIQIINDQSTNSKLIGTSARDGIFIGLTTREVDALNPSKYAPKSTLYLINLYTEEQILPPFEYELAIKLAQVRFFDGFIHIVAIGSENFDSALSLYYLKFDWRSPSETKDFKLIQQLTNHICPKQMSWSPRGSNFVMISSSCGPEENDSYLYQFELIYEEPSASHLEESYRLEDVKNYYMCAQSRLINVIDWQENRIFSLDSKTGQDTKLFLPLKELGLIKIKAHTCDQDNNLLQVIACKDTEEKDCYLVTYRANLAHMPQKRVHSILKVPNTYDKIASSFDMKEDLTMTILAGTSTSDLLLHTLFVDGPHVVFDASKIEQAVQANYEITLSYPTFDPVSSTSKEKETRLEKKILSLKNQETKVTFELLNKDKKMPADGTLVNIEEYVEVHGPYHSLGAKQTGAVQINDRLTKSRQFNNLTQKFDEIMAIKDYYCGFTRAEDSTDYEGVLHVKGKHSTQEKLIRATKVNMHIIERENVVYFFVHAEVPRSPDILYIFLEKAKGLDVSFTMDIPHGFDEVKIIPTTRPDEFVLAGFNNEREYMVYSEIFKMTSKGPEKKDTFIHRMGYNIADFDLVNLGSNNLIIVCSREYSRTADFILLSVEEGATFSEPRLSKQELVPGVRETHEDTVFGCDFKAGSNHLQCVSSGKNMYSYLTEYEVNVSAGPNFISSAKLLTKFKNIVNLQPTYVEFQGNFVVFLVRNNLPLGKGDKETMKSFFEDVYLCLVYKLNSPTRNAGIPERDVYKILTVHDLGLDKKIEYSRIKPRIISSADQAYKLLINVGSKDHSVTVFNMDPLSFVAPQGSVKSNNVQLAIKQLDGSELTVEFQDFINDSGKSDGKKKSPLLVIVLTIAIVLVLVLIFVGVFVVRKNRAVTLDEEGLDDLEKSRGDDSANYTKF